MAIDRGPWNTLIDDDGSNLVGTIWNKDKIKTTILDPIDGTVALKSIPNSDTGSLNNWTPAGLTLPALVLWSGASATTITGIAGGQHGQTLTIKNNSGTGAVLSIAYYSTSSVVTNRVLTLVTSAATPIASGGWVTLVYHVDIWILIAHEQGAWITPAFSAADYSAAGSMAWTVAAGNIVQCSYRLSGRSLQYGLYLSSTSLSGTASGILFRNIPGGFTVPAAGQTPSVGGAFIGSSGINVICLHESKLTIIRDAGTPAFPLGVMNLYLSGTCPVQ